MVSLTNFSGLPFDAGRDGQSQRLASATSELGLSLGDQHPAQQQQQQQQQHQNQHQHQHQQADKMKHKYQFQVTPPALDAKPVAPMDAKFASAAGEHFEIRWSNLTYQVEPKWYRQRWNALAGRGEGADRRRTILNALNGSVKSGEVTAILGPSGAGKTSLLSCLTGKNKSGVSGQVQILSNRQEPMSICTIPQKDFLLNQLTVRENLEYASRLKHPEDGFDHDANIERVLDLLKLESCIDTKISKISGGQHKRVSIAQELLSNPDILILDEPTSGLDSLTCYRTVMVLRDLARLSPNPMAIIVTIHQPQREVFDLFNHVYILAIGGRCIYEGHPSHSISAINERSGGLHFDADQYNPASYLVEIASAEFGEKPIEALVENQRNEFARRTAEQDSLQPQATPGLKKRQSPMVARFKSTLSSLTGNPSPPRSPQPATRALQPAHHHHHHQHAYLNEAYALEHHDQPAGEHPSEPAPAYMELDPNSLGPAPPDSAISNYHRHHNHQLHPDGGAPSEASTSSRASANGQPGDDGQFHLDYRLQTHKHNHKGHFLRHCQLLTKRSWLCLCKDPMLTTLRFTAHIIVPLLITLVYGSRVGKPNACPLYETDMDLIDYARRGAKRLVGLQDELRCTFENVGLYFLSIYAFTFSTMCLTSLSFPLNMHVLLKEVRNGWYSIPTYFIGKTLADFPLEFILPTVTLMITYPLTGQPSSHMEWRFLLATGIFVVTSLIAQTQGLIFGALFMNAMQAAVFVAPVSTTPLILLSGFLIRISQMPVYLQKLSSFSYFRYAIESLTIIRYGFDQCPCDPAVVNGQPVSAVGVPDQLRTMTNYWLSTFESATSDESLVALNATNGALNATDIVTTTTERPIDFFQDLTVLLARANSFGADIRTCEEFKPYPMIDFGLNDNQLWVWVGALIATLIASKIVNYIVVKYSVKWRL